MQYNSLEEAAVWIRKNSCGRIKFYYIVVNLERILVDARRKKLRKFDLVKCFSCGVFK